MALIDMDFAMGGKVANYEFDPTVVSASKTYSDMEIGTKYIVFVWGSVSSGTVSPTKYDTLNCTGATYEKLGNLYATTTNVAGTFFVITPTSSTVTITTNGSAGWTRIKPLY